MNFDFSEEQTMLRDGITRFLGKTYDFHQRQAIVASATGTSAQVWQKFVELGLLHLPHDEANGGLGGTICDSAAFADLFGRHLVVEPYVGTVLLASRALALANDHPIARDWLARTLEDGTTLAFAHEEGTGTGNPARITTKIERNGERAVLSGAKRLVLDGAEAALLVVTTQLADGAMALALVDPKRPGVTIRGYTTVDGRRAANIDFAGVAVDPTEIVAVDGLALARVIEDAILFLCGEAVGAAEALVEVSSAYAATRQQFGVPIARFQAIAHLLADMKIASVKLRASLLYTLALRETGRATPRDISLFKAQAGRLGRQIGESAVQIHGGVGMTDELIVGHYLKRLLAIDAMFGSADYHLAMAGRVAANQGGAR